MHGMMRGDLCLALELARRESGSVCPRRRHHAIVLPGHYACGMRTNIYVCTSGVAQKLQGVWRCLASAHRKIWKVWRER
jgi:hypothetical protein